MPRHEVAYEKKLKETHEWQYLYTKWRWVCRRPHSEAFNDFRSFYDWSMANGFQIGTKLELLDDSKPYSPENCLWVHPAIKKPCYTEEDKEWISKWNETVNRIRRHFGLKPFE